MNPWTSLGTGLPLCDGLSWNCCKTDENFFIGADGGDCRRNWLTYVGLLQLWPHSVINQIFNYAHLTLLLLRLRCMGSSRRPQNPTNWAKWNLRVWFDVASILEPWLRQKWSSLSQLFTQMTVYVSFSWDSSLIWVNLMTRVLAGRRHCRWFEPRCDRGTFVNCQQISVSKLRFWKDKKKRVVIVSHNLREFQEIDVTTEDNALVIVPSHKICNLIWTFTYSFTTKL